MSNRISPYVRSQIVAGQAILFLGAGATIPAKGRSNTHGMSGSALRDRLCDKFLGGEGKGRPLNYIADRCTTVAGMGQVHRFIKDLFWDLQPTSGHLAIPKFKWKGIVTTNYDLLIERAYEQTGSTQQSIERIIWDRDDFDAAIRNPASVPLLKLHGCLNRINDPELPLVISSHDYYKFKTNRGQLVSTFREWGSSYPVIFCGYSLADENVKEILFDLTDKFLHRPQYVIVDPGLEEGDIEYWKSLRFDCLPLSFDDFMADLQGAISDSEITLTAAFSEDANSVTKLIPSKERPSNELSRYLTDELQHVHSALVTTLMPPSAFYRGTSDGFAWVKECFDVRRRVSDTLLEDAILASHRAHLDRPFLYVLKGYAGSGKTVTLKRFAWEAAADYDAIVFYLGPGTVLRVPQIRELAQLIKSRLIVVLDDILLHSKELREALSEFKKARLPVTFVGAARTNEWNVSGELSSSDVDSEYELLDLSRKEVEALIERLSKNKCLGYLEHYPAPERITYFLQKLKSQLLVSLHEATEGKSFEEIVVDEYQRVMPEEARLLYLDVCTLDRFDVGVRAGLMGRLSGVTFQDFSSRLLRPLEYVINVHFDHRLNDYLYRTRHQNIAQIVFEQTLQNPQDRAAQIIRILKFLNGAYATDRLALQQIVRGRYLAEQFTDKAYALQVFDAALECGLHPSVVDHQRAVFELHHSSGDIRAALALIQRVEATPGPLAIRTVAHTKSNILRRLATTGRTALERQRCRQDALSILNQLVKTPRDGLPFLTRGQLLLEQLEERLAQNDSSDADEPDSRVVAELTKEIESNLRQGLQLFPDDERLLNFEAELSKFLNNSPRALRALERAYSTNRQSVFTAIRLARQYAAMEGMCEKAVSMLRKLTAEQPLSKDAHYELARLLASIDESKNADEISQHLRRSFVAGDAHIEARFAYARHEYLYGKPEVAKREFEDLKKSGLSPETMNQVRKEIRDSSGCPVWFDATVVSVHDSFAFVNVTSLQGAIFMHFTAAGSTEVWESIVAGLRVKVCVGFSYKGPRVKKVQLN